MKEGYTRVTQILSPFTSYSSIPLDILQAKALIGTKTHQAITAFLLTGGAWDIEPEVSGYFESMRKFWKESYPIVELETRLYCDELKLTGEMDLLIEGPKGLTLIDWKTSVKENATWQAQCGGYEYLCEKNGYAIKDRWFVKLDKKGGEPTVYNYKKSVKLFMDCFEMHKMFFSKEKHLIIEELIE